jgi:hypothetical protein
MTSSTVERTLEENIKENLKSILPDIVNCGSIFSESFMKRNTRYASIADFLKAGHFHLNSPEDCARIPLRQLDRYVKLATRFRSWSEMYISAATIAYNTPAPAAGSSRIGLTQP